MKGLIIDDSMQARTLLKLMLKDADSAIQIVAEAGDVPTGLELAKTHQPDVIFLDIEMPLISGLSLPSMLIVAGVRAHIIFITAYQKHAIKAFELSAMDYLLKPINPIRLKQAIDKVCVQLDKDNQLEMFKALERNLQNENHGTIAISVAHGRELVPFNKILYIKAEGSYSTFVLDGSKEITASRNLSYFERKLPEQVFFRTHRSYIVNLQAIKAIMRDGVLMVDESVVPISRKKRKELQTLSN